MLSVFFLIISQAALAATDDFTIRTLVGGDTEPPTTPTILSATPITTSQIDVVWSTSTDNFSLAGYRLFRDSVQIATTTLTSFSDTGLTENTLYTYEVNAFDAVGNTSTTSLPVATTTLETIITPTSTPTTTEERQLRFSSNQVQLQTLDIITSLRTAAFDFSGSRIFRYVLRWGRTTDFESGFIATDIYAIDHVTEITDLEPGTTYEYELVGINEYGRESLLSRDQFTTSRQADAVPPPNVSNVRAVVEGENVQLFWDEPLDPDFKEVRVMRNYLFYPNSPQDGFFVYQGGNTEVLDVAALRDFDRQYYTVFSYDEAGNISSGAIVLAVRQAAVSGDERLVPGVDLAPGDDETIDPAYLELQASDVSLEQPPELFVLSDENIVINGNDSYLVSLPYEVVPEHLKSIIYDVIDGEGSVLQSFLLRINKDKSAYEAVVPAFAFVGPVKLVVHVFDHQLRQVRTVAGEADIVSGRLSQREGLLLDRIIEVGSWFFYFLLALSLLMVLWLLGRRRKSDKTEDSQ
ncbi:MAG: hypothetical protein AAGA35_02400 [Patescibacteria group bacterium]